MRMSSESFAGSLWWNEREEPVHHHDPASGTLDLDVAVIGGGFTGLSTALHLAEAGIRVGVFETRHIGFGASGRNGGQVIPGLKYDPSDILEKHGSVRGEQLIELAGGAANLVFDLIARHNIQCAPRRSGWIQAAHSPLALRAVLKRAAEWQARGVEIDFLGQDQIVEMTGTAEYCGGWRDRRAGTIQPLDFLRGLARATRDAGGAIFEQSHVQSIVQTGDRFLLKTENATIAAKRVVVATNAYTGPLIPGLARSILPVQSMQIATEPLSPALAASVLPSGAAVSETRKLAIYMRMSPEGRFMIGGRGAVGNAEDPVLTTALEKRMVRIFPRLAGVRIDYRWSGHLALSMDGLPHFHEDQPGRYSMLAYNGRGIALSVAFGRMLANEISQSMPAVFPRSSIRPILWHRLRRPIMGAGVRWYWMKDRLGFASK